MKTKYVDGNGSLGLGCGDLIRSDTAQPDPPRDQEYYMSWEKFLEIIFPSIIAFRHPFHLNSLSKPSPSHSKPLFLEIWC